MSKPVPQVTAEPTPETLLLAYEVGTGSRVLEEHIVRLASRGEVKFAIWGTGEEVHGVATALALHQVVDDVERVGIMPHYRSGALVAMWCALHDYPDFGRDVLRQQFSRDADRMSRGRQMVNHLDLPELGILPVQSPVGMQLGKAAGYALGFLEQGITDGLAVAVVGDGTTAEGDLHDAMNAASVWKLPLIVLVTDNGVAISTLPEEGRGIKDFESYAAGFGIRHLACDGRDFFDTWRTTLEAARYARHEQRPVLLHARHLPRFNGHSSAADMTFDLSQDDPLVRFGQQLVERGLLAPDDVLRRIPGQGRDFFAHHALGAAGTRADDRVRELLEQVRSEPDPAPESILEHVYAPFPRVQEPQPGPAVTSISYAGAIRSALHRIISEHGGYVCGQDVGRLGGVMTATAGLKERHPDRVIDSPLNEPLIVGTALGAGLHAGVHALPEIQFGDYSFNAFHWLVHLGNLHWCSAGRRTTRVILRMPVDPFGGGAVYHSMSVDGYFTPIPGLVICMPSTSWDVYGLLMTAARYDGPVVMLEPKWLYRQALGPAFHGEPSDPARIAALKKSIMRGEIPELPPDHLVPFGRGVTRRAGDDLTIVAWGRASWRAIQAAEALSGRGISAEVIDLRSLVPMDLDLVLASVQRTGRLLVASEDRPFAGFARSVQGQVVERLPGTPTRVVGQRDVPGIPQSPVLEDWTTLSADRIAAEAAELCGLSRVAGAGLAGQTAWIPPRFFVS